jgi:hypothetical protein
LFDLATGVVFDGHQVWNKQRKYKVLIGVEDFALDHTRHDALIVKDTGFGWRPSGLTIS